MKSVSPPRDAVGAAIRQLGHDVVGHVVSDELLNNIAAELTSCSEQIVHGKPRSRLTHPKDLTWDGTMAEGEEVPNWGDRPFSGPSSPWSLEPVIRRRGNGVVATVTFGAAHEGAPGRAHGGLVAALFDDILGSVLAVIGVGAFTGELAIRYANATPLHRELLCTCRLSGREGRKLYMTGELTDQGQLVCSATATFIEPKVSMSQTTFEPD